MIAACTNACLHEYFRALYDVKGALGRAYKKKIPEEDNEKNYRDGYRFCSECQIYLRNFEGIFCPCCGWKTRIARKNIRGKIIMKRYASWKHKPVPFRMSIKEDIRNNLEKINKMLKG